MRILVCGSRDFLDYGSVERTLERFRPPAGALCASEHMLILGGARGADSLAEEWADRYGVRKRVFKANWYPKGPAGGLDRGAGFKRNQQMLDEGKPNLVIAFPGGNGTADMMRRARKAGVPVQEIPERRGL